MDTTRDPVWNQRLRQARIEHSWRQRDLAERLGTTAVTVKRWERGTQQPSTYFLVKLCVLFGKSAEELGLVEEDHSSPSSEENLSEIEQAGTSSAEPEEIWMVPYTRNLHFTGRDDLLERLTQVLTSEQTENAPTTRQAILSQPQAVKGLGGIGKTQLAVEYSYRSRELRRYTHTFWINAASEEAILTSFQTLADQLPSFEKKDEQDQHKLITAVLGWMEQCSQPWLLILDNADDFALAQPYLPRQGQGSILLTTRATAVGWLANSLEVDPMGLVEGTQFLLHRSQRLQVTEEECNEAANIVIALGGFPLALDQAGAYIEETGCSFSDYLQLYEQHHTRLLARRGKQATNYPNSVATTWSLSFQQIEQTNPAAAELLRLCAFLAPDHIPEELLREGASHWPTALQQAVTDLFAFNQMLEDLLKFSLIKRLVEERMLSIHRLVQTVQRERMEPDEQKRWVQRAIAGTNAVFPSDPRNETATWSQCQRYLEQVQVCDLLIQQYELLSSPAADLLYRAGIYLCEHALYALAEPLYQRALWIWQQIFGKVHPQIAYPLNNLGELYMNLGKYTEAEAFYLRALAICEQQVGPEHPLLALVLNGLGVLYNHLGKYKEAEVCYQRALHIREQQLGPEHLLVGAVLHNLAYLYKAQGKYAEAEALYLRTLRIWKQQLGPEHPQVAALLNNLGELYKWQGKHTEAEELLWQALHIWEKQLGEAHPQIAYPLMGLGELYGWQSRYTEAEALLRQALHIWEKQLGETHPLIAHPLTALANLFREQDQYEQGEQFYQRALMIRQKHLDPQHIEIAETLHELAQMREKQLQLAEALSLYQQALPIREQILGSYHSQTTETRQRLCAVLRALGRTEEAEVHLDRQKREDEQAMCQKH